MKTKYKCLYEITGRIEDVATFLVPISELPKEPEQEPVAQIVSDANGFLSTQWADEWSPNEGDKLYTKQEPAATSQATYNKIGLGLAEAGCKLSEQQKMALASLVQDTAPLQPKKPEQEPVAWLHWLYGPVRLFLNKDEAMMELDRLNREYPVDKAARQMKPLYTTPPQRTWVGLTDEEIEMIVENKRAAHWEFVRQVEAKLKELNT